MKKELIIKEKYDIANPDEMASMANVLKEHIIKHNLYTPPLSLQNDLNHLLQMYLEKFRTSEVV